ncbi:MAG: hypothetical protein ACYDHH_29475 [Solirubrobacteraceae bacterium]
MNRKTQLIAVWCGPLCAVLFAIGAALLGRFIPPYVRPHYGAAQAAHIYAEHASRIRLGAFIACISMSLVGPWGCSIAAQIRRTEGDFPILTYISLTCVAIGTTIVVLMCCCWGVAAFRPGDVSPQITQFANDLGYFIFLFTWPPFSVWGIAVALAIFTDQNEVPVFPRWLGYLSVWTALLFVPAGLMIFFKTGAFSWAGLMTLYVPVGIFFVWLAGLTYCTIKNINAGHHYVRGAHAADRSLGSGAAVPAAAV